MSAQDDVVESLIETRGRALTGYAYLLCGNLDDAEDLVQDALVKTFGRVRNGFGPASAEAYVRRSILTTYLDRGRTRCSSVIAAIAVVPVENSSSTSTSTAPRSKSSGGAG